MKRPLRLSLLTCAATVVALLLPLGSCRDGGPAAPRAPRTVALSLAPSFAVTAVGSAPIVAIRAVALDASTQRVVTSTVTTVDPNATSWPIALTIPLLGAQESVMVTVELLSSTNPVVVEWSGEVGPIEVKAGETQEAENVTLGRGSLDNLKVTGVTIAGTPATIVEGDPLTLVATATGASSAEIFWSSLDAAVATVDAGGKVTTVRDGSARIVASAGTKSDTSTVTVLQRPASIVVAPDSLLLTSVGAQGTLAATVKDARGAPIVGATVTWSSGSAAVATSVGAGVFQAVANGRTTAVATSSTQPSVSGSAVVRVSQAATQLAISAGQSQTAAAGTTLATPPTVLVTDAGGAPVPGASVTFAVASGGGSVGGAGAASAVVTTNASGLASTAWKLGPAAGANTLTATVAGAPAVTFDATATPAPPGSLTIVSGDAQSATVGSAVANPLVVKVLDALGNPASGVSVTFAVASGGGSLGGAASAVVATDASGLAASPGWTLGSTAGANTVTATVAGVAPVTFTATGTPQPASSIVIVAGGNQLGTPGQIVPVTPQVKVLNAQGAPAAGVTVTFAIIDGYGFFEPSQTRSADVVTDAAGLATSPSWQLGGNPATNTMTATVAGLAPVTFVAETIGSIVIVSGNNQTGTTGTTLPQPLVVKVLTTAGVPMSGQTVQFTVISGSGGVGGPTTWTTSTTAVTDSTGLAAAAWQLGFAGPQQAGANVPGAGLAGVIFNANASAAPTPTTIQIVSGNNQSATVGAATASPLVAKVLDQTGAALAGTTVTFTVTAGGGTLGGQSSATATTDATGNATSPAWMLGTTAGTNSVKVSAGSAPPVTFDATATPGTAAKLSVISGSGQTGTPGTALTNPLVAGVTDAFGNAVPSVTVTWTASDGTANPASSATDATGHAQTSFTPGYNSASQTVTASATGLTSVTFNTTVTLPSVGLSLVGVDKVSLGRQASVQVALTQPAPAGGLAVTVTSGTPSVLAMVNGGTVTIPAGQTTGTVTVSGAAEGTSLLTATAPPFLNGTLSAAVELRLISMPATLSVPFGQTASLPITLARPAPAGGTVVTLTSRNPSTVGVTTSTVTIPAGSTSGNGVLSGVNPGSTLVDATNPLYDADSVLVTTAAALNFTPTSASLNTSFGTTATVQFTSNGVAIPAPAPGVTVSFTAASPTCVAVPATATIATGLTSVSVPITYGGSATTPCTSQIFATAPSITPDTISATVQSAPAINITGATVGAGLQRYFSGSLGASNGPATTVTIKSPDATLLTVAPDATTKGTASIDIPLAAGVTGFSFYAQAVPGKTGQVTLTASASQFTSDTAQINVVTPAFDVQGVPTSLSSIGADAQFYVRTGIANGQYTAMNELQAVSASASAATATATVSDVKIAQMIFGTGASQTAGQSASVTIPAGQYNSPTSLASGGFALRGVQNGNDTVRTTIPGFTAISSTTSGGTIGFVVVAPTITLGGATVGAGLQRYMSGSVSNANPAGMTMHVRSSDPTRVKIAPDATSPADTAVDIVMAATQQSFSYYVHGLEGQTGSVSIGASTPGYTPASATITEVAPAFDVQGVPTTMNAGDPDRAFYARIGIPNGQLTALNELQAIRTGGTALTVSIRSSQSAVVGLVQTAGVGGSASTSIGVGQYNSPSVVAQGGVAVRALGNGTSSIVTAVSGATAISSATTGGNIAVTVNTPATTIGSTTVGSGLMTQVSGSLAAPAPAGGLPVTIYSADSTVAKLAPNATTVSSDTITLNLAAGATSFTFYVHGMEGKTGAIGMTAQATGYTASSGTATIVAPAFDVQGLPASMNTLDANQPFYVRIGIPNGNLTGLNALQAVRFGAPAPVTVMLASSDPNVGGLEVGSGGTTGQTAMLTIAAGQYTTPGTLSTGAVAFDPITSGSTTITTAISGFNATTSATTGGAITVTVKPPALTVSSTTVGAGLETSIFVSLGSPAPAGLRVTITSSQPSVTLVSPSATAPGVATFDTTLTAGTTGFNVYVQGIGGTTGAPTVSASAAGFSDGSGVTTVVQPAIGLVSLPTSTSMSGANTAFYVRLGVANSNFTAFNAIQSLRVGGGPLTVTVTSSDATVGQLVVNGGTTGATVTAQIAEGTSNTPFGATTAGALLFDPIAAGTTTVTTSASGYAAITSSSNGSSQVVSVTSPAPPPAIGARGAGPSP